MRIVYSDVNFELLGEIVNRVSGKQLNDYAREAVFGQGYLACPVAQFLACHPSSVSRAFKQS